MDTVSKNSIQKLRNILGNFWVIVFFGVLYFTSQITIATILNPIGHHDFLALQFSFSQDLYFQYFVQWQSLGLMPAYKAHLYFDTLHPIWYTLFLLSALSGVLNLNQCSERWNSLFVIPVIAGFCDVFENCLQMAFLSDPSMKLITKELVFISSFFSSVKWSLALGTLFFILIFWAFGLVRSLRKR